MTVICLKSNLSGVVLDSERATAEEAKALLKDRRARGCDRVGEQVETITREEYDTAHIPADKVLSVLYRNNPLSTPDTDE